MRAGGSKQKGAGFERKICVALSKWLSKGHRKDLFWRSAMSGGRATLGARKGEKHLSQGGDVSAIDPMGAPLTEHFCIEIKFYKDLDLGSLLFGRGKLADFWKKARLDAAVYGKEPMLIAKQNLYDTLVIVRPRCKVPGAALVLWESDRYQAKVCLFDDMLKTPYVVPAVVERFRPRRS